MSLKQNLTCADAGYFGATFGLLAADPEHRPLGNLLAHQQAYITQAQPAHGTLLLQLACERA